MLKCSPEAFAKCSTRKYCGSLEHATFTEGSDCDKFNRKILEHPLTNGDRIRCMSDEELERFINHFNICDIRTNDECKMSYCACCEVCVMDWLQQPAEVAQK